MIQNPRNQILLLTDWNPQELKKFIPSWFLSNVKYYLILNDNKVIDSPTAKLIASLYVTTAVVFNGYH